VVAEPLAAFDEVGEVVFAGDAVAFGGPGGQVAQADDVAPVLDAGESIDGEVPGHERHENGGEGPGGPGAAGGRGAAALPGMEDGADSFDQEPQAEWEHGHEVAEKEVGPGEQHGVEAQQEHMRGADGAAEGGDEAGGHQEQERGGGGPEEAAQAGHLKQAAGADDLGHDEIGPGQRIDAGGCPNAEKPGDLLAGFIGVRRDDMGEAKGIAEDHHADAEEEEGQQDHAGGPILAAAPAEEQHPGAEGGADHQALVLGIHAGDGRGHEQPEEAPALGGGLGLGIGFPQEQRKKGQQDEERFGADDGGPGGDVLVGGEQQASAKAQRRSPRTRRAQA
jgi:hypothetical protein